jgi:hypothetical protein
MRPSAWKELLTGFFVLILLAPATCIAADTLSDIRISATSFNPSRGEKVRVLGRMSKDGILSASVVDRDGHLVRKILKDLAVKTGEFSFEWHGRDNRDRVVADESYSFLIEWRNGAESYRYFPAAEASKEYEIKARYWDPKNGVLSYELPRQSRVHIQAGTAVLDSATREMHGPVLRTIANREVRDSGVVVESWNGFDESNSFAVYTLPKFVVAIAATSLPENSVIAYGNRERDFLKEAPSRQGKSLLPQLQPGHHHRGLSALEDVSPSIDIKVLGGKWNSVERRWDIKKEGLRLHCSLSGLSTQYFVRQPGEVNVYVDRKKIITLGPQGANFELNIPASEILGGEHVVAVNWPSLYGPAAVGAMKYYLEPAEKMSAKK